MTDVINWIQSTAFPALSSCWSFFKQCISDLISLVTGSKLVFFFALFLIGAVVSALVWLLTSLPSVDSSSDYPVFNTNYRLLGYHDLYNSGFYRPVFWISKGLFRSKAQKCFKSMNLPFVIIGGYKFYNPNYKNKGNFKQIEYHYFNSKKSEKKSDSNLDIEVDD